jgi:putative transposase
MGRPLRSSIGNIVYHALNRSNTRIRIFSGQSDYAAFERLIWQACSRVSMRLLAYCIMPNHFHLVLWPRENGDLTAFMAWLELTHAQRWHSYRGNVGTGHLYQGRFKSFPVADDEHLITLGRYVEGNALRTGLVARAEDWRWGSLWWFSHQSLEATKWLEAWPVEKPADWIEYVNDLPKKAEVDMIRTCIRRGRPLGSEEWQRDMACNLGLGLTLHPRGRPRKRP